MGHDTISIPRVSVHSWSLGICCRAEFQSRAGPQKMGELVHYIWQESHHYINIQSALVTPGPHWQAFSHAKVRVVFLATLPLLTFSTHFP